MNKLTFLIPIILLSATGCAGKLYTYDDPNKACENDKCKGVYPGVLVFPRTVVIQNFMQDKILGSKGEVTHWVNGPEGQACTPTHLQEERIAPDTEGKKRLIRYKPAFFETSELSVDLNADGTLSEVATSSTPGGESLVDSIVSLATTVRMLNATEIEGIKIPEYSPNLALPLCSHGRVHMPEDVVKMIMARE